MANSVKSECVFSSPSCLFLTVALCLSIVYGCLPPISLAQNAASGPAQANPGEAAITDLEKQVCAAWAKKDVAALGRFLAEDFVLVAGSVVSQREEALQFLQWETPGTCSETTVKVRVYDDTAWAASLPILTVGGKNEQWQVVDMWTKHKDQWQIERRNSARLNPAVYVEQALDLMRQNSLNAAAIDWVKLRKESLERAASAEILADAYPAIRFALAGLGDHHSHLELTPELERAEAQRRIAHKEHPNSEERATEKQVASSPYVGRYKPEGHLHHFQGKVFARVVVPKCPAQPGPEFVRYETQLQKIIAELDAAHPVGWIVDLRGNVGGNMWPMLAGIGPLLGEGDHLGEFFMVHSHSVWFSRDGVAGERDGDQVDAYPGIEGKAYHLASLPPVAVLIDRRTGSSGEAIAVAFRGRAQTRFFGEHTEGVSTVNYPFQLIDSATMWITIGVQADRTGKQYKDGISPDEEISGGDKVLPEDQDKMIQAGLAWLAKQ